MKLESKSYPFIHQPTTKVRLLFLMIEFTFLFTVFTLFQSCDFIRHVEHKAKNLNQIEEVAISLNKENRELKMTISKMEFDLQKIKARNVFLEMKLKNSLSENNEEESKTKKVKSKGREIASVGMENQGHSSKVAENEPTHEDGSTSSSSTSGSEVSGSSSENESERDFRIYKWKPEQLLKLAEHEFQDGKYGKAYDYFKMLIKEYPDYGDIDDLVLFQAGVSAYKSDKSYDQSIIYLSDLIQKHPTSKFFRGAKLWMALAQHKKGNDDIFFKVVDEFRLKYRNTSEWKILSAHYDALRSKYKR